MIQLILSDLWIALQVLIGYNLVLPLIIYLFYLIKPKIKLNPNNNNTEVGYAIIVTAYEQTHTLPPVIDSLLRMKYSNYIIYVVADKCDVSKLHFTDERVVVLRPPETLGSNTRSHFYAINHFKREHERLTIIDSDNLVEPDFLKELNVCFDAGFVAVQGERKAKNLDTTVACLDAARDIYYHFYDGKILFEAGSSATLAGSGMAFTVKLYKDCLEHLDVKGAGFDKVLQKEIVSRGHRIAFTNKAVVYDEKTSQSEQLVKQRARWINTWFKYFGFGFKIMGLGMTRFSWNQFLFGLILLRPPLFIFLILSVFLMGANVFLSPFVAMVWLIGFALFVIGFFMALLLSPTDAKIYQALTGIPKFVFYQVLSLLKVRNANKYSVATQHFHDKKIEAIKE